MEICKNYLEKFVDRDECVKLIDELETKILDDNDESIQLSQAEKLVETFRKITDKYQQQPELLEPHLPELISLLTNNITSTEQRDGSKSRVRFHAKFKYLYQLIKITGFKSVGKRFPHETDKLPMIICLLEREGLNDKQDWQTRFVLTVWLSIVILTPFDLSKFDAGLKAGETESLTKRIYTILMNNLSSHDSCQHVTAYCLAKFFSRPDLLAEEKLLDDFMANSMNQLGELLKDAEKPGGASAVDGVKLIGLLRTQAYIYKFLPRSELQRRSDSILRMAGKLNIETINGELVSHLLVKLMQRVGLALLPKSLASWRFKRGARILGIHQKKVVDESDVSQADKAQPAREQKSDEQVIDMDVKLSLDEPQILGQASADWLESILSILFLAAQNGQTRTRWSAAKGIARLASRLDRQRASDVIDMVLGNFFDTQTSNEFAWHGGCLTLAEMSRQGLILVEKLNAVAKVIQEAIVYDRVKGSFAVGAHVREAACYVVWAMARAYDDHHLGPYTGELSINLMCTIVFDRELQCRRAASATFQELIGRRGAFDKEALALLADVDYQNVGMRQFAYLDLAARVARIGGRKYYENFIEHLIEKKLAHWDVQIRRLASESLGLLMLYPEDNEFIEKRVFKRLFELFDGLEGDKKQQQADNNVKHGALLALARVIKCLVPLGYPFGIEVAEFVARVGERCEKQLNSKQQAGNFLEAICLLVSAAEQARFNYDGEALKSVQLWERLVLQALDSDNSELRNLAAEAHLSLYRFFYGRNKTCQDRLLTIANKSLSSANESSRCGALRCLSMLGQTLAASDMLSFGGAGEDEKKTQLVVAALDQSTSDLGVVGGPNLRSSSGAEVGGGGGPLGEATTASPQNQEGPADLCGQSESGAAEMKQLPKHNQLQLLRTGGEIKLDSDTPDIILMSLTSYLARDTREKSNGDLVFAQAKADCCDAFVNFVRLLDKSRLIISTQWLRAGFEALVRKTEDYTFDKRGDIGVVVRKAAVRALQELCSYLLSVGMSYPLLHEHQRLQTIVSKILQQCVSYNNAARELAAISFYRLISSIGAAEDQRLVDLVPHFQEIVALFEKNQVLESGGEQFNWRDDSTSIFVQLLGKQEYSKDLWLGLMPALGQASELCAKQFRDSLSDFIRTNLLSDNETEEKTDDNLQQRQHLREQVFGSFLQTLEHACGLDQEVQRDSKQQRPAQHQAATTSSTTATSQQRLLTSGLQTVDFLLTQGLMNETSSKFQQRIVELCWLAANEPKRMPLVSRLLCSMLQFQSHKCLQYCLALLASRYPTVRVYTAEQLYSNLMLQQLDEPSAEDSTKEDKHTRLNEAMELLSQAQWTEPLEKTQPIRAKICSCLCQFYSIEELKL